MDLDSILIMLELINLETFVSIGHHVLIIEGMNNYIKEISFTIEPFINIKNNQIYHDSVNVYHPFVNIKLNGSKINDSVINSYGNYRIEYEGINGYSKIINFTIGVDSEDLIESITYTDKTIF